MEVRGTDPGSPCDNQSVLVLLPMAHVRLTSSAREADIQIIQLVIIVEFRECGLIL